MQSIPPTTAVLLGLALFASAGCSGTSSTETSHGVRITASGEELAQEGIAFPSAGEVTIVDGWQLEFRHVLVTLDHFRLALNPDKSPTDPSVTDATVAEASGPWAIDLQKPGDEPGAGGEGSATLITTIPNQNRNADAAFASDERYAFGYDAVAASESAIRLNFDADADAAYETMIREGYSVLYVGTATFKGVDCEASASGYDFDAIPKVIPFELGFATPTSYENCQNQENQGDAFPDEAFQRGIAIPRNAPATAQVTLHIEHPFFSSVVHDSSLYVSQMAAQLVGRPAGTVLTIDTLTGVDPSGFVDARGDALPYRSCTGEPPRTAAQMSFDVGSVPLDPSASPALALRDYADYVRYLQSTQGHLNGGEGICLTNRSYPSPP